LSSCNPRQSHRQAARAPIAALVLESPCNFVAAGSASAVLKIPLAELVPIALDEQLAATGTPCAAAFAVVNVARVNVMKPLRPGDLAGARKRRGRRVRFGEHFEVGMERCEMPGNLRPEIFRKPFGRAMKLRVAVVLAWNNQGG